jgi:tetratricopeptide (TPR) repeat protein
MWGHAFLEASRIGSRAMGESQSFGVPPILGEAEEKYLDSLRLAAQTREPFPDPLFEALLLHTDAPARSVTIRMGKKHDKVTVPKEFMEGAQRYEAQDYKGALEKWAVVVRTQPTLYFVHQLRSEAWFAMQGYDSAIAELRIMGDSLAKREASEVALDFDGRAMVLHSIGYLYVQKSDYAAATQAYKAALEVDFGFYMAHARLAGIAMQRNDLLTARSEMELALQQNDSDPFLLFGYGYVLSVTNQTDQAIVQLRKAIAVDPYYAAPYAMLGRLLESQGRSAEALTAYQGFIDHAARSDPELVRTVARVAAMIGKPGAAY